MSETQHCEGVSDLPLSASANPSRPRFPADGSRRGTNLFPLLRCAWRLVATMASVTLLGCAQPPTGSGYLGAYLDMRPNRYLDAESHLPWLRIEKDTTLVIQPVQPYFYRGRRPSSFPGLARSFQAALRREIEATGLFESVTTGSGLMVRPGTDWTLNAVITEAETGLASSSLQPGVTSRGSRRIWVEGKISNTRAGRTLLKFKDARVGLPGSGPARTEADVESGWVRDLEAIARSVADTLREIYAESRKVPEAEPAADRGRNASTPAIEGEGGDGGGSGG